MGDTAVVDTTTTEPDGSTVVVKDELTVEQMQSEIDKLKNINQEVIQSRDAAKVKLREFSDVQDKHEQDELVEKEKFKELYESLNTKHESLIGEIREQKVEIALGAALKEAGVTVVPTALKLIDKSTIKLNDDNSIIGLQTVVDNLKENHAVVFAKPAEVPDPARPSEDDPVGGYLEEMKQLAAKPNASQRDFDKLKAKYGK